MAYRTFLALDIDEATRAALVAVRETLDVGRSKINWVVRRNLHVTLKFIGDADGMALRNVCAAAAEVAGRFAPFDFDVRGLRTVPPKGEKLRMVWAGVEEPSGALAGLFTALESALREACDVAPEPRAFHPHITLARVQFSGNPNGLRCAATVDKLFGRVRAEHVTVYTSRLTPQGPVYTPAAKVQLHDPQ
jgi:2'-5' RNA ligase